MLQKAFSIIEQTALQRFYDLLPDKPNCGNDKPAFLIRNKANAIKYDYIQANPPHLVSWLSFDIDHKHLPYANCLIWQDEGLPPPNLIVKTASTGRAHLHWAISPVCVSKNGRAHPKRYLKAIRTAMAKRLKADGDYTGRITKNPFSSEWKTTEIHAKVYELGELADSLELVSDTPSFIKKDEGFLNGRNCILFQRLRFWAYQHVGAARLGSYDNWLADVISQANGLNNFKATEFSRNGNLDANELKNTAKSIASWTWDNYQTTKGVMNLGELNLSLDARQRLSARRTHTIRTDKTEQKLISCMGQIKQEGLKLTQSLLAKTAGISRQQISRRYKHLLNKKGSELLSHGNVTYGVNQITAPVGAVVSIGDYMDSHRHINELNTTNSPKGGGVAAKKPTLFKDICTEFRQMEKICASDGVSIPILTFENKGRLAKMILMQKLSPQDSVLLAGSIVDLAANNHPYMTIDEWCAYIVSAAQSMRLNGGNKIY